MARFKDEGSGELILDICHGASRGTHSEGVGVERVGQAGPLAYKSKSTWKEREGVSSPSWSHHYIQFWWLEK